jgi:hypothetical protein
VGFRSLTTTTHPPNVNLPSSGQKVTARLSARKVSVTGGNRAQDPLVRDTTLQILFRIAHSTMNKTGVKKCGNDSWFGNSARRHILYDMSL